MSQLLCNIESIISAFDNYAKSDGDCATLSKGELKRLIQKEFAEVIVNPYDAQTIETVFQLLDTDCDGQVDFEEFTVLVFRVARACYKKARTCQAQGGSECAKAAEQPEKSGDMQCQSQGKRTPSRGSPRRSTQQPRIPGRPDCHETAPSQASSQECEPFKLETGGQSREPVKCTQEPTGQTGSGPAERRTEEGQEVGRDQSRKLTSRAQGTEQDRTQQLSQEPPSQVEGSSRRRVVEPQTQEDDSAQRRQASQQSVAQEPQGQTQNLSAQQEHKPQMLRELSPTQRRAQETEQCSHRGQIEEVQRREQEVTSPKPQETVQGPSRGQVREPQRSEQRGSRQRIQESQVEQESSELQTCPEQHQTHQRKQNSHTEERITCQQESLRQEEGPAQEGYSPQQSTTQQASGPPRQQDRQTPGRELAQQMTQNPPVLVQTPASPRESGLLSQGQGPACRSKEASPMPPQQPTPVGQRAEQVSPGRLRRDTWTEREHPTGQRERQPLQVLETNRAGPGEQEPPSPQKSRTHGPEHECSGSEQPRGAQAPAEGQSCHQGPKPEKGGRRSGSAETPPVQGSRESSARQGIKTSPPSFQQAQRPPHWTSKQ